jgi:hypothetical protein
MPPEPRVESNKGRSRMTSMWDGAPLTLAQNEQAIMPQTPNGSAVLAWLNMATQNNSGTLALTTDGTAPQMLEAPALMTAPNIVARNWHGADLRLTNISADPSTSIWIQMLGLRLPGVKPIPLPLDTPTIITSLQTAEGRGLSDMQLILQTNTNDLTIVAIVGGPMDSSGNNAYLFALNFPVGAAPPGYTAVTSSNSYTYQFNWGISAIFVTNLSGGNSAPTQVVLRSI